MKVNDSTAVIGAGIAACAVCCAGPILGFLAAIGLGTVVGVAVLGIVGIVIALLAIPVLVRRRRRRRSCAPASPVSMAPPTGPERPRSLTPR